MIFEAAGFQGDYAVNIWEWLKEVGEGFGQDWESNWMRTWRMACEIYARMMTVQPHGRYTSHIATQHIKHI